MARNERQVSFENEGQKLYGFLHLPVGEGPHPAIVLLHGFGGNHIEPHALFPKAGRALAAAGIGTLRFDFRGSGNSEGAFRDVSITGEVSDARRALAFLAEQPGVDAERIGVAGLSLGGMIAACTAGVEPRVRAVALWAAVANLGELFQASATMERMQDVIVQGYADVGGLEVGQALIQEAMSADPVAALGGFEGPVLVVHGTADATVPAEHAHRYKAALGERAELELIEGADHVFSSLAWEGRLIERTREWLRGRL